MDINDFRSIVTVMSFVVFIGIVFWAYSGRRKAAFDEAAQLVMDDDESGQVNVKSAPTATDH